MSPPAVLFASELPIASETKKTIKVQRVYYKFSFEHLIAVHYVHMQHSNMKYILCVPVDEQS